MSTTIDTLQATLRIMSGGNSSYALWAATFVVLLLGLIALATAAGAYLLRAIRQQSRSKSPALRTGIGYAAPGRSSPHIGSANSSTSEETVT
jgi:hypothetical protein